VLNIALSSLPGSLSLGEVENTVRKPGSRDKDCTCGKRAGDCPVWSTVLREELSAVEGYQAVYRYALNAPGTRILVDSPKGLRPLLQRCRWVALRCSLDWCRWAKQLVVSSAIRARNMAAVLGLWSRDVFFHSGQQPLRKHIAASTPSNTTTFRQTDILDSTEQLLAHAFFDMNAGLASGLELIPRSGFNVLSV
jgi:hypothetical protein